MKTFNYIISPEILNFKKFSPKLKIGVLASGEGTNFQELINLSEKNKLDIDIRVLITNIDNAGCITRAKNSNIPIKKISQRYGIDLLKGFKSPDEWIIDAAKKHTSGDKRRMANKLLEDFRNQMLGNFSLEVP